MNLRRIIRKEMAKSNGAARVVKVPQKCRPTQESLRELETEIAAQLNRNDVMRSRSMERASKMSAR